MSNAPFTGCASSPESATCMSGKGCPGGSSWRSSAPRNAATTSCRPRMLRARPCSALLAGARHSLLCHREKVWRTGDLRPHEMRTSRAWVRVGVCCPQRDALRATSERAPVAVLVQLQRGGDVPWHAAEASVHQTAEATGVRGARHCGHGGLGSVFVSQKHCGTWPQEVAAYLDSVYSAPRDISTPLALRWSSACCRPAVEPSPLARFVALSRPSSVSPEDDAFNQLHTQSAAQSSVTAGARPARV